MMASHLPASLSTSLVGNRPRRWVATLDTPGCAYNKDHSDRRVCGRGPLASFHLNRAPLGA